MTRDRQGDDPPPAQPLHPPGQPGLRRRARATRARSAARTTAGRSPTPARCSATPSARATAAGSSSRNSAWPACPGWRATRASSSAPSPRTGRAWPSTSATPPARSTGWCGCRPRGEVELTAGWLKHKVQGQLEDAAGERDRRLPPAVRPRLDLRRGRLRRSATCTAKSPTAVSRDLGGGHTENDLRPEFRRLGEAPAVVRDHARPAARLRAPRCGPAYGDAAEQIMIEGSPHVMIFPNLFIAEIQIFVIATARRSTRRSST